MYFWAASQNLIALLCQPCVCVCVLVWQFDHMLCLRNLPNWKIRFICIHWRMKMYYYSVSYRYSNEISWQLFAYSLAQFYSPFSSSLSLSHSYSQYQQSLHSFSVAVSFVHSIIPHLPPFRFRSIEVWLTIVVCFISLAHYTAILFCAREWIHEHSHNVHTYDVIARNNNRTASIIKSNEHAP